MVSWHKQSSLHSLRDNTQHRKHGKTQFIYHLFAYNISSFVAEQRENTTKSHLPDLFTPVEREYIPGDQTIRMRLGLDDFHPTTVLPI
jgi:hypothetical protein